MLRKKVNYDTYTLPYHCVPFETNPKTIRGTVNKRVNKYKMWMYLLYHSSQKTV